MRDSVKKFSLENTIHVNDIPEAKLCIGLVFILCFLVFIEVGSRDEVILNLCLPDIVSRNHHSFVDGPAAENKLTKPVNDFLYFVCAHNFKFIGRK